MSPSEEVIQAVEIMQRKADSKYENTIVWENATPHEVDAFLRARWEVYTVDIYTGIHTQSIHFYKK